MAKRVLVVDDSSTVREQVAVALAQAGFDIVEAIDGREGLDVLARDREISLVLCDLNMPRMDGLEMVQHAKGLPANAALPIVMLTTEGQPEMIERAKRAGARGWIVKPFKQDQLVAAVKKLTAS